MDSQQRIVIITGGAGGLGRAITALHLKKGDQVIITGRHQGRLEEIKQSLGSPPMLHTYPLDVCDNEAVRRFAAWVHIQFERCDFLYNNAGTASFAPFLKMNLEDIRQTIDTNLMGMLYVTRAFLPMMVEARSGRIIQIASLAGHVATAKAAVYAASKAAVIRFSEGLRHELRGSGVHITCAMPGPIDTPFLDHADATGQYRKNVGSFLLTAEQTARSIVRAAEKRREEVALPTRLHLLAKAYLVMPEAAKRFFAPLINRK
ncbi:SDR family NAD(P)-dependent oxidoreductase [Brevibacillus migulae]|uniref:SDR family NAD(P)-dependent oxidoreductase n=1 Tax=Brevibacillus migulae TaxID=1644114 RepID=UPI00106EC8D1|nr:SDR family NAD(P)-dependent oxidoreductase [Brevibacillus migulae]